MFHIWQHPVASASSPKSNHMWRSEATTQAVDSSPQKGIPTLITWSHGGENVVVEGSWDNWGSRYLHYHQSTRITILVSISWIPLTTVCYTYLQEASATCRQGSFLTSCPPFWHISLPIRRWWENHSFSWPSLCFRWVGKCLPCSWCQCKPHFNLLIMKLKDWSDQSRLSLLIMKLMQDYVPESLDGVSQFQVPGSPDSSYDQEFPEEDDFARDPVVVPSQLHVSVLDMPDTSSRPQHVVLNHLYMEKGRASESVVALGLTQRFESKYVTVVLYKPLKRWRLKISPCPLTPP